MTNQPERANLVSNQDAVTGVFGVLASTDPKTGENSIRLFEQSELEQFAMVSGMFSEFGHPRTPRMGLDIADVKSVSSSLREMITPDPYDRGAVIAELERAARDIWIVRNWLRLSADLGSEGLTISCINEDQDKFCKELSYYLNWQAIDYKLQYFLTLYDSVYIWWKYYDSGVKRNSFAPDGAYIPEWVEVLAPSLIEFTQQGQPAIRANMLNPLSYIARKKVSERTARERRYINNFPEGLVKAATKNGEEAFFLLDELEDDKRFGFTKIEHPSKADWQKWAIPKLYTVLADIKYVLMCADVDFSAAYQMKAGIIVWSIGPENPDTQHRGPSRKSLTDLEGSVRRALEDKNPHIFSGNDFNVRWIVPPEAIFMAAKYNAAMHRIMDTLGVPAVFYPAGFSGESISARTYGSSLVAIKPYRQAIETTRRQISMFGSKFFSEMCRLNNTNKILVGYRYDQNVLVEDRVIIAKAQLAAQQGLASNRSVVKMLGMDFDAENFWKEKEIDQLDENPLLFVPHYSTTRGTPGGDGGGRPPQSDDPPKDTVDQPRPGQASDELTILEDVFFDEEALTMAFSTDEVIVDEELSLNIEVSKDYIRIPMNPGSYDSYRMGPLNNAGIRFLYGIKNKKSKIATVLFNRDKWTLKEAKEWIKKKKGGE